MFKNYHHYYYCHPPHSVWMALLLLLLIIISMVAVNVHYYQFMISIKLLLMTMLTTIKTLLMTNIFQLWRRYEESQRYMHNRLHGSWSWWNFLSPWTQPNTLSALLMSTWYGVFVCAVQSMRSESAQLSSSSSNNSKLFIRCIAQ